MPRTIFLYAFLIILLIAGCKSSLTPEPLKTPTLEPPKSNLPALDSEWTINMAYSGGIMGLSRSIEISSDGRFSVTDERAGKKIIGNLSADDLSKLNGQVRSSEYFPASKLDGMGCADCFIYDLNIQGDGKNIAAQLNDINLPNSGLEALVVYLRGLIETALK